MISTVVRTSLTLLSACLLGESLASAMAFAPARLSVYRRGEALFGEDFAVANEQIVDYVAALRHPTGPLERIVYNCSVKARITQPSIYPSNATTGAAYTQVTMVYDLKDCVEAADQ